MAPDTHQPSFGGDVTRCSKRPYVFKTDSDNLKAINNRLRHPRLGALANEWRMSHESVFVLCFLSLWTCIVLCRGMGAREGHHMRLKVSQGGVWKPQGPLGRKSPQGGGGSGRSQFSDVTSQFGKKLLPIALTLLIISRRALIHRRVRLQISENWTHVHCVNLYRWVTTFMNSYLIFELKDFGTTLL